MFFTLLLSSCPTHNFFSSISTANYVVAYKELRKERLVAADDVGFITILEGLLNEAKTEKVDEMNNLGALDEQIVDVESEIDLVEINLRALQSKKETIIIDDDSDSEYIDTPPSKKPCSEIRVGKQKTWTSEVEMDVVIGDVFKDMNTSQHANVADINYVVDEQQQLE